jgi:predicted ribosomally synthesized peptide with SipW-like signal peptide
MLRRAVYLSTFLSALAIGLMGSNVTLAAFSDSAENSGNTFSAAANWGCATPGGQTVTPSRDAFIQQGSPNENKGGDANLFVESKTGSLNQRTLVGFTLPTLPSGCSVTSATLRLYNKGPTAGRSIEALQVSATWTEMGVTWNNQPGTTGTAATSTTVSAAGWQTWTVTSQVQAMYSANHGFLLRDATESSTAAPKQNYPAREDAPNDPELIVNWG